MKTIEHFRKLYDIVKKDGLKAALKYDINETKRDLDNLILGSAILADELCHTTRIKGYRYIDEEVIPPDKEGFSLHQAGWEPIYERIPIWKK